MNELTKAEMTVITGGEVSSDAVYGAAIGVSVLALGALITIATGGVAAPLVAIWGLGVLGTGANITALVSTQ